MPNLIIPDWPAPPSVKAVTTTRLGGISDGAYASFNLAHHVGDDPLAVAQNRAILSAHCQLPNEPLWLDQVHSNRVFMADAKPNNKQADACVTQQSQTVCAVLTADCLPILLCNQQGNEIAAIHAGWRGLLAGVIENTLHALNSNTEQLLAWLGPAIGSQTFEVGPEVQNQFCQRLAANQQAFQPHGNGRYLADIYQLARIILNRQGVQQIYGGDHCTFSEPELFYSYRRDGQTGRMASLIWLTV